MKKYQVYDGEGKFIGIVRAIDDSGALGKAFLEYSLAISPLTVKEDERLEG